MSRIAVDFDGTLVKRAWPGVGAWFDGAVDAMNALREAGHTVFLYSARTAPEWPDGSPRSPASVYAAIAEVRQCLDAAGLTWMDIWEGSGKPNWDILIDDKAMWFPGRDRSWSRLVPQILLRIADEDSFDAVMEHARREEAE